MLRTFTALWLAAVAVAEPPATLASGGVVRGRVRWVGPIPNLPALRVPDEQQAACGKSVANERLLIGPGGGVGNAVVWIDAIEDPPRAKPIRATVEQRGCVFSPHVQVVPLGSRLDLTNSDGGSHDVRAFLDGEGSLFQAVLLAGKGKRIAAPKLLDPGVVDLRCDAGHAFMSAWIHVAVHPWYTVTAADGTYTLSDVPPGDWVLRVWHEGWMPLGDDPPTFSQPVLLDREIQVRTSKPAFADFDLRDF